MKRVLLSVVLVSGCAAYHESKSELTAQIRRGIDATRQSSVSRQALIEGLNDLQLSRLDDAFDADVRSRPSLERDWVIAHRKAYAIARDAVTSQRYRLRREQETIDSNLDLIDKALRQLQLMHELEHKLSLSEVIK